MHNGDKGTSKKPVEEMTEDEVMREYNDLVEGIATKLMRTLKIRVERDDLIAYGRMGLLQAHRRYDPSSRAAFSSYAYYRIRGSMYDGCRKEGWATRERRTKAKTLQKVNAHLESNHASRMADPQARTLSEATDRVSAMVGDVLTLIMVSQSDLEDILVQYDPPQDKQLERKAQKRATHQSAQAARRDRARPRQTSPLLRRTFEPHWRRSRPLDLMVLQDSCPGAREAPRSAD